MARDRFKKVMFSPYFQSEHYHNTAAGKVEDKLYKKIFKIKFYLLRLFK